MKRPQWSGAVRMRKIGSALFLGSTFLVLFSISAIAFGANAGNVESTVYGPATFFAKVECHDLGGNLVEIPRGIVMTTALNKPRPFQFQTRVIRTRSTFKTTARKARISSSMSVSLRQPRDFRALRH